MTEEKSGLILCCLCGTSIKPNPANMCLNCLQSQVDITEGISKEEVIFFCRDCERYLQPPKYWVACDLESKELLSLCLKRITGLSKVKLKDASFIYTEEHSKRLKVKVVIQKEVFNGAKIQQKLVVEFIVKNQQCDSCKKQWTPHKWVASVQLRQKADHKRTVLFIEQLVLKHNLHTQALNIVEQPEGIDFFYSHRSHALKFIDFVSSVAPTKVTMSKKLISHDMKSNVYDYKYSFLVELPPICRGDLICLPKEVYRSLGGIGPLVICHKINSSMHFMDPTSLKVGELTSGMYWKYKIKPIMGKKQLVEFTILDAERQKTRYGKYLLSEVEVVKTGDIGESNRSKFIETHLGNLLDGGDRALGYDIENGNFNDDDYSTYKSSKIPEVILISKYFERRRRRKWKLKKLDKEVSDSKKVKKETKNEEEDAFMEDLEEDEEMRSKINLYKDETIKEKNKQSDKKSEENEENEEGEEEYAPEISEKELLDDPEEDKQLNKKVKK